MYQKTYTVIEETTVESALAGLKEVAIKMACLWSKKLDNQGLNNKVYFDIGVKKGEITRQTRYAYCARYCPNIFDEEYISVIDGTEKVSYRNSRIPATFAIIIDIADQSVGIREKANSEVTDALGLSAAK